MDKSFYVLKHNIITSYVLYILSLSKYPKIWYNNTCKYTQGGMKMLDDFLIHVFHKGNTLEAYKIFGAHFETTDHKKGVRFTVYAPMQEVFKL